MNIPIVYEDENIIVINKPAKLITHPKNATDKSESVAGWFVKNYPEAKNVGENPLRPGIIHRLDKDVSGLLILAKCNDAFFYFKKLFQEREIKKYYLALVYGHPKKIKRAIDKPLGKIGIRQTTRIKGKRILTEKNAVTEYKVVKNLGDYSLLEVRPHTGRMHQIRVHLKSIGHPIIGDLVYGPRKIKSFLELNRIFLHAYKLEFTTQGGQSMILETDLPEGLQKIISGLE